MTREAESVRHVNRSWRSMSARAARAAVYAAAFGLFAAAAHAQSTEQAQQSDKGAPAWFLTLLVSDAASSASAMADINANWERSFVPMAIETLRLSRDPRRARLLIEALENNTGEAHGYDLNAWLRWMWNTEEVRHPEYAAFKSALYGFIDVRFESYFDEARKASIRLDEVVWGGVGQDGIPPLRGPKMIDANAASYLEDGNVVFGVAVNDDVRAYPKRILAWHEMFTDTIGGVRLAGVYCTLCGSVILYETELDNVQYDLGTSGFLYRSNKLMYDRATQSLWNTLWGKPVIGPLVDKGIRLKRRSLVTTTWGEWRRRHPGTKVLALETGHARDYGEGVAYKEYFATDELMFEVPQHDDRLANKDEVLALLFADGADANNRPLAIASSYLDANTVYQDEVGGTPIVVVTDSSGANRVYEARDVEFTGFDNDSTVMDASGTAWRLTERSLAAPDGRELLRLPAHRAFWFGWYAAYSHTRLVK